MAQVPYQDGVASVAPEVQAPQDYSNVRASPASFGGLIGQGLSKLGQGATQLNDFYNQVSADQATTNYMEQTKNILYGDPSQPAKDANGNVILDEQGNPVPDTGFTGLHGADALHAAPQVQQRLTDLREQTMSQLKSPMARLQFDNESRRYESMISGAVGSHLDQSYRSWAADNNNSMYTGAINLSAQAAVLPDTNPDGTPNTAKIAMNSAAINQARKATTRQAQLQGDSDPDSIYAAKLKADRGVYVAQIQAIAPTDPVRAQKMIEAHQDELSGPEYQSLFDNVRTRATEAQGRALATQSAQSSIAAPPAVSPVPGAPASTQDVVSGVSAAILNQESGGNPNAPNSAQGAVGPMQIEPGTAAPYLRPGESLSDPVVNQRVGHQIISDLAKQTAGDPQQAAKIAVGYFSGPGNIAPPGSPTPWIRDVSDANGTTVSSYVAGIQARLQTQPPSYKASTFQSIAASDASPDVKAAAFRYANQQYAAAAVAADATAAAQKQANDTAANGYISKVIASPPAQMASLVPSIANDPNLTPETREGLIRFTQQQAKANLDKTQQDYGSGYYDIYKRVMAAPGDPNRITDPSQILAMVQAGGPINTYGAQNLVATLQKVQHPNSAQEQKQIEAALDTAKRNISFDGMYQGAVQDPVGMTIYNSKFIPSFYKAYNAGIEAGKTPYQLLDTDSKDNIVTPLVNLYKRTDAERAADYTNENGQLTDTDPDPVAAAKAALRAKYAAAKTPAERQALEQEAITNGWAVAAPAQPGLAPLSDR